MKKVVLPIAIVLMCALLGGCFNTGNQPEPMASPMPDMMASPMPGTMPGTMSPMPTDSLVSGSTPAPGVAGAGSSYNWQAQSNAVESRINMFSEIQESRIVAEGGTALVGVKFANAYQGEMTQRIRDMIAGEVMAVDNSIQVVAVTAEANDVEKIFAMSDQQRAGGTPADFKQQIDQMARNTSTLR